MKIVDVKAIYPKYKHVQTSWRTNFWQIVVRIQTDSGDVGYGYGGGGIAGVDIINRHFKELLIGKPLNEISDISSLWDMLYEASLPYGRKGLAIMALSGVDIASYDLLGKAKKEPVYNLIGGLKNYKIRSYATGDDSELYHNLGYTAHKFPHRWEGTEKSYDTAVSKAAKARELFGKDALIMTDVYMSWNTAVTVEMATRLKEFNLFWFEDILTPDDLEGQASLISEIAPILVAGGEHEFTHHGFSSIAKANALGLWQPDITWCGGITSGIRIVQMANSLDIPVSPHRGGEIWGLHLMAATDCLDLAEYHSDHIIEDRDYLWLNEPTPKDGYISPTHEPGFGVTLNEKML